MKRAISNNQIPILREILHVSYTFAINCNPYTGSNVNATVLNRSARPIETREKTGGRTERIREYGFIFGPELALNGVKRTSGRGQRVEWLELPTTKTRHAAKRR